METTITRYKGRNWAIRNADGELLAVTVYRKGATRIAELLAQLPKPSPTIETEVEL